MKKKVHVKEYTRKKHGRASHGGKVRSHTKSGRIEMKDGKTHYYGAIVVPSTRIITLIDGWHEYKPATEEAEMLGTVAKWFTSVDDRAKFLIYAQSGKMGVKYRLDDGTPPDTIYLPTAYTGGRAKVDKKRLIPIMKGELEELMLSDYDVGMYGASLKDAKAQLLKETKKGEFKDLGDSRDITLAIIDASSELDKEFEEQAKAESELHREYEQEEFDEKKQEFFKPLSKAVRHHGVFSGGRASPYVEEQMRLFRKDYRRKWKESPTQQEDVGKRLDLEKTERERLVQLELGKSPEPTKPQTVGSRYNENIHTGNVPQGEIRRSIPSRKPRRSLYRNLVNRQRGL